MAQKNLEEIVVRIDERTSLMQLHIVEMVKHLEKINNTNLDQEVKIAKNKDRISMSWKIGGGLLGLISSGAIAILLYLLGII